MADEIPQELSDAALLARANRAAMAAGDQAYTSSILPFSYDAQGKRSFDLNAGIIGTLGRAVSLPSQVVSGEVPAIGPDAKVNPELIRRSAEMASTIASPSPSFVAGSRFGAPPLMKPTEVPTAEALKAAGSAGYNQARATGMDVNSTAVANMTQELQSNLHREGFVPETSPITHGILDRIANPPPNSVASVDDILSMRRALNKVGGDSSDQTAAGIARRTIDNFLGTLDPAHVVGGTASPQDVSAILRDASRNYAAAQRSNDLTGTLDRANTGILERAEAGAQAANSGANLDNSIRQRIRAFLEQPKEIAGFSEDELQALRDAVKGSFVQNRLRDVSNLTGGGRGLGALVSGVSAGATAGALGSPWLGAAIGAGVPGVGMAMKAGENAISRRNLLGVDELVRQRSPLYEQAAQMPEAITPQYRAQMELLRALGGAGLLSQQPQRPGMLGQPQIPPGLVGNRTAFY